MPAASAPAVRCARTSAATAPAAGRKTRRKTHECFLIWTPDAAAGGRLPRRAPGTPILGSTGGRALLTAAPRRNRGECAAAPFAQLARADRRQTRNTSPRPVRNGWQRRPTL